MDKTITWIRVGLYLCVLACVVGSAWFGYSLAAVFVLVIYFLVTGASIANDTYEKLNTPAFAIASAIVPLVFFVSQVDILTLLSVYLFYEIVLAALFVTAPEPQPAKAEIDPVIASHFAVQIAAVCQDFCTDADTAWDTAVTYCRKYDIHLNGKPVTGDTFVAACEGELPKEVQNMLAKITRDALRERKLV